MTLADPSEVKTFLDKHPEIQVFEILFTNMAGVPVDASVAATLRPMWPLLPMPITTTRPRHCTSNCTAAAKRSPTRSLSPATAAASMSNVSRARRKACAGSKTGAASAGGLMAAF